MVKESERETRRNIARGNGSVTKKVKCRDVPTLVGCGLLQPPLLSI